MGRGLGRHCASHRSIHRLGSRSRPPWLTSPLVSTWETSGGGLFLGASFRLRLGGGRLRGRGSSGCPWRSSRRRSTSAPYPGAAWEGFSWEELLKYQLDGVLITEADGATVWFQRIAVTASRTPLSTRGTTRSRDQIVDLATAFARALAVAELRGGPPSPGSPRGVSRPGGGGFPRALPQRGGEVTRRMLKVLRPGSGLPATAPLDGIRIGVPWRVSCRQRAGIWTR